MKPKIAHLSSVHSRYDTRIYYKMCNSLAKHDYEVCLIIADNKGDEVINGISILDVGREKNGRLFRMTKTVNLIFEKAINQKCDIYHLHDPELIPIGLKLKKLGKKVIYDSHEDFPKQLLTKPYLVKPLRILLSIIFKYYEKWTLSRFDYLVAATPFISDKLSKINANVIILNNYPVIDKVQTNVSKKKNEIVYIGGISKIRGIHQLISALSYTKNIKLNLAGYFTNNDLKNEIKNNTEWKNVNYLGFLDQTQIKKVLGTSQVGIVTFLKGPNHTNSQPNKLFEYMTAGIPVVASNFQLWSKIIEINKCGICVDPLDPRAIGQAIQYLIDNPSIAEEMGKNGFNLVKQKYNWFQEEEKLLELYKNI